METELQIAEADSAKVLGNGMKGPQREHSKWDEYFGGVDQHGPTLQSCYCDDWRQVKQLQLELEQSKLAQDGCVQNAPRIVVSFHALARITIAFWQSLKCKETVGVQHAMHGQYDEFVLAQAICTSPNCNFLYFSTPKWTSEPWAAWEEANWAV